jgi:uncharacterized protein (UPF0335 family)
MFSRKPDPSVQAGVEAVQQLAGYLERISAALERLEKKVDTIHDAYKDLNLPK